MAKPTIKKPNTKGAPPAPPEAPNNTAKASSADMVQLHIKITPEQRRDFKAYALERDLDANQLFLMMWEAYREQNG